jgi:hypothetical protein
VNHDLEAMLFKAWYIARWSSYVPFFPDRPQWFDRDWYEALGTEAPDGAVLVDIFPLKEAQTADLERLWQLP